MINIKLGDK
jgi:uncharacterized membrane protein (UPF0127 family)